jgi:outer membrane murein-binding lipoprotein Lpp
MKKFCISGVLLFSVILSGCIGTPSSGSRKIEPPRREFQSVESGTYPSNVPSIIDDFVTDDIAFTANSINFSTALFLADVGILTDVPKELFEKYATVLFSQFPREGEVKKIIIPGLSLSQEEDREKDAYLFITKNKSNEGRDYYLIESNIPVGSISASTYDGYVMRLEAGFYKNQIPARWTSIMNIMVNGNILLYRGIAYPSKSAPLIFTGTGIGSDVRMNAIVSDQVTVSETVSRLENTVEQALQNTEADNQRQADSVKFLEKSTYLSLSAYSYIDSDSEKADRYFLLAKGTETNIPDDTMGSRYKELERIMDYLLNMIE